MEYGRISPPNLYKIDILRKTKQEYRYRSHGVTTKVPVYSVIEFKHNSSLFGSFRGIRIDPFMVHYWTRHQIIIFKDIKPDKKKLS